MAKYKAGDKAVVRKDLSASFWKDYLMVDGFGFNTVTKTMSELAGQEVTIEFYDDIHDQYSILESEKLWTDEMFEDTVKYPFKVETDIGVAQIEILIKKVVYNDPATILFYSVGFGGRVYKSIAKCDPHDEYDPEKGRSMAILKALRKEIDRDIRRF